MTAQQLKRRRRAGDLAARLAGALGNEDVGVDLGAIEEARLALLAVEEIAVNEARDRGWTWQEISRAQGMSSRQAAHNRWARRVAV